MAAKRKRKKPAPVVDMVTAEQTALEEREQAESALQKFAAFEVVTPETYTLAGKVIVQCREEIERIEDVRKSVTGPLNQALRGINAWFKPVVDTYKAIDAAASDKRRVYDEAHATSQQEALQAIEAGDRRAETIQAATQTLDAEDALTKVWRYELHVVDFDAIPREFLAFDAATARAWARSREWAVEIPGVEIRKVADYRRVPK